MKRVILGLAVAAAAAFTAPPASANQAEVVWCGFTPPVPCGVCVAVANYYHCVDF